jgi:hypothetical protein
LPEENEMLLDASFHLRLELGPKIRPCAHCRRPRVSAVETPAPQ